MGAWIVGVNYGSHDLIKRNFSWRCGPGRPVEGVVVVDNYSTDRERADMSELCRLRMWLFVPRDANDGFAVACNAGVRAARGAGAQQVLLVNPDALVQETVVEALGEQLTHEPMTMLSPRVVTSAGASYFQGAQVDLRTGRMRGRRWGSEFAGPSHLHSDPPYRDWLSGACLAFSVHLWESAGALDERYFLYWEDVDFSQRCVEAGGQLCLRRDLVVVHDEGGTHGTQGSRARSPLYYFYNCRNRLLYGAAHLSRRDLMRWILSTPQESWQILLRGGRRQLLQSPRPALATLRGSLAGLVRVSPTVFGRQKAPRRRSGPIGASD